MRPRFLSDLDDNNRRLLDAFGAMVKNAVFKKRTVGLGTIDPAILDELGVTGTCARAAAIS